MWWVVHCQDAKTCGRPNVKPFRSSVDGMKLPSHRARAAASIES